MNENEVSKDRAVEPAPSLSPAEQKKLDAAKAKKAEDDAAQRKERLRAGVS